MTRRLDAPERTEHWIEASPDPDDPVAEAVSTLLAKREVITAEWAQLCRWDPELPPDAPLTVPPQLVTAIASALTRPQPVGWGLDPALAQAVRDFAGTTSSPETAVGQLVCLGYALDRHVVENVPPGRQLEVSRRLQMIVQRLAAHCVRESTHHLRTLAFIDALTGLPNRRAFDDDLAREVSRSRRHGDPLSVAIVDIDGLKSVNDTQGHAAGDEALRSVATLLRSALRHEDVAYRIGGDEFAILFPAIDAGDGTFLRERIGPGNATVTIGVASSARDPLDDLVAIADRRLYEQRGSR
ncbi:MAG TPA: GGDEF domain-containing protein [Acidimicrobiales bacterium]